MNNLLNLTTVLYLTNKSGVTVSKGDTVIIDSANNQAFTTTTTSGYVNGVVGVVLDATIANNTVGAIAVAGWIPQINLSSSASLNDFFKTHTVAKQAVRHAAPEVAGDFGQVLSSGTNPPAVLFTVNQGGSGDVSTGTGVVFYDRRWVRGSTANALDDEFRDGAIDGSWTRVDDAGHSGYVTWTEAGDSLSLLLGNSADAAAELHAYLKADAMSIGDYIQCHIVGGGESSNFPIAGLIISNGTTYGAGKQAFFGYFMSAGAAYSLSRAEWSGFSTRDAFTDTASTYFGEQLHIRLKYSAANTFEYYYSPDGISWILIGSRSITLTPSHVGIAGSSYGSSTKFVFSFDYFRVNP